MSLGLKNKTFLAIIPARAGSKRLPKKNTLSLHGKPLIHWSIEAAKKCTYINHIVVSSDDDAVLRIAEELEVAFIKRPSKLSTDTASTFEAVEHTIKNIGEYDYIILLQPTSPLRQAKHINEAILLLEEKNADAIVSVCKMEHNPLWSNEIPDDGNMNNFLDKKHLNKNSQDLKQYFRLNGAIYICKTSQLLKEKTFFIKDKIYSYLMTNETSIDIDEKLDFEIASLIMRNKEYNANS